MNRWIKSDDRSVIRSQKMVKDTRQGEVYPQTAGFMVLLGIALLWHINNSSAK